jgi:hypothetical protein
MKILYTTTEGGEWKIAETKYDKELTLLIAKRFVNKGYTEISTTKGYCRVHEILFPDNSYYFAHNNTTLSSEKAKNIFPIEGEDRYSYILNMIQNSDSTNNPSKEEQNDYRDAAIATGKNGIIMVQNIKGVVDTLIVIKEGVLDNTETQNIIKTAIKGIHDELNKIRNKESI